MIFRSPDDEAASVVDDAAVEVDADATGGLSYIQCSVHSEVEF